MTVPPPPSFPDAIAAQAEEVRAWFVELRGGAPFLSSKDGRLLIQWLEADLPVSAIFLAIEKVAARRQARRTRTPFHLDDCEATLKKLVKERTSQPRATPDLARAMASPPVDLSEAEALLLGQTLTQLSNIPEGPAEDRARAACRIVQGFHSALWELYRPQHPQMIEAAAKALEDLAALLGNGLARAAEERAKEQLRQRYPALSATRIWEEFGFGLE